MNRNIYLLQDLTPLNLASYYGHLEVVKVLLDYGANVDALDEVYHRYRLCVFMENHIVYTSILHFCFRMSIHHCIEHALMDVQMWLSC